MPTYGEVAYKFPFFSLEVLFLGFSTVSIGCWGALLRKEYQDTPWCNPPSEKLLLLSFRMVPRNGIYQLRCFHLSYTSFFMFPGHIPAQHTVDVPLIYWHSPLLECLILTLLRKPSFLCNRTVCLMHWTLVLPLFGSPFYRFILCSAGSFYENTAILWSFLHLYKSYFSTDVIFS